jgi:hypothetical protein
MRLFFNPEWRRSSATMKIMNEMRGSGEVRQERQAVRKRLASPPGMSVKRKFFDEA